MQTPREIIRQCFPSVGLLPITGGWGMSQDDPCVIDRADMAALPGFNFSAFSVIRTFVEKRIYFELIASREMHDRYSGIAWSLIGRKFFQSNGRFFEFQVYEINAFKDADWEVLKAEWEGSDGISSPDFDFTAHRTKRDSLRKVFHRDYWFDLTGSHAQKLFGYNLPWEILGFIRGYVTDYESQRPGLGYSVSYHWRHEEATLYVYDNGNSFIPDDPTDDVVVGQLRKNIDEVYEYARRTEMLECTLLSCDVKSIDGKKALWLCAEFSQKISEDDTKRSYIFLRGHRNRYIKVRMTVSENQELRNLPFEFSLAVLNQVLGL